MSPRRQPLLLAVALLAIFAGGFGTGWFGHRAGQAVAPSPPVAAGPVAASGWTDRALVTLTAELGLDPAQVAAIRPLLNDAAGRMDLDKERALFQLHMQVLKAHDEMRPHLRPAQLPALERMRERLKNDITRRFAAFLQDQAQPVPDL